MFHRTTAGHAHDARTQMFTGLLDATAIMEVAPTAAGVGMIADHVTGPDGWLVGDVRVPADHLAAFAAEVAVGAPRLWPTYVTASSTTSRTDARTLWADLREVERADQQDTILVSGIGLPLPGGPAPDSELNRLIELTRSLTRQRAPLYVRWCPSRDPDRWRTLSTLVDSARAPRAATPAALRCDVLVPADSLRDPSPVIEAVASLAAAGIGMRLTIHACRMSDEVLFEYTLSTLVGAMLVAQEAVPAQDLPSLLASWPRVEFTGNVATLAGHALGAAEIRLLRRHLVVACGRVRTPLPAAAAVA